MELTHVSLFSGIGGIDLAAEWAGFETILFVEKDNYCQQVLRKHWPDVPIIGDVRDVTKEKIMAYTQSYREGRRQSKDRQGTRIEQGSEEKPLVRGTKGDRSQEVKGFSEGENTDTGRACGATRRPRRDAVQSPITLITGGFPCQPVSTAGKQGGKADDRWLWPDMLRVISEVRPTWVVAENVTGLLTMGFYDCLSDLEGEGYETISFVIPACGVNAPHRRYRIFIVGHSTSKRLQNRRRSSMGISRETQPESERPSSTPTRLQDATNSSSERLQRAVYPGNSQEERERVSPGGEIARGSCEADYWAVEPELCRVFDELSKRLDSNRLTDTPAFQPLLQGLWGACQEIGYVSETLSEIPQIWGSLTDEEKDWVIIRCCSGNPFHSEWPGIPRVAKGVKNRVDRLRCLGNAVVPQQIYPILKGIADILQGENVR